MAQENEKLVAKDALSRKKGNARQAKDGEWKPEGARVDPHPYDNTLKAWFGEEAKLIIAEFLPGAQLLDENADDLNIEIDRTKLKADLVYSIRYEVERQLLNMELHTNLEEDDIVKMLQYALGLYAKHKLCVISILLLPFSRPSLRPPFVMMAKKGTKKRLIADYEPICLPD